MELLVILLFAACIYLWLKNNQLKEQNSHAPRIESKPILKTRPPHLERNPVINVEASTPAKESRNIRKTSAPEPESAQRTRGTSSPRHPTFNTGIPELDGPGMWQRLNQYPTGHALYLLYSAEHNAYKVGKSEPDRIDHRIKMVQEEVPDVVLDGIAVFTSHQKAFDKEQEVLKRYKSNQYLGIKGRYSGTTEWITVRPTGRPYFTTPEKIEERFRESIEAELQELDIPDHYTVYLLFSKSKNMYKCSWCKTENLPEKIRRTQRNEAEDAELVSRFRVENHVKARAITIRNNEMEGSYRREGRQQIYEWCENPEYLYIFDNWDENGSRRNRSS